MPEKLSIRPYKRNAKVHTPEQIGAIARSIKEFGFNQPIVVDREGVIIVGHGRYEASKLLGIENPPYVIADLTKKQAAAYRLADNKLNESVWDMPLVAKELESLSFDLSDITGFDVDGVIEKFSVDIEPEEPKQKRGSASASLVHVCPACGHEFGKKK